MKRTFLAFDIQPASALKEAYEMIRYRMRLERINWVSEGNIHITLNFFGDTSEELLTGLVDAIGKVAERHTSFELTLQSAGVFKNLREPRVIWIGCDACPPLLNLKENLDKKLQSLGFEPEGRPFSPHLTLGRVKEIRQINHLAQLITQYKNVVFQKSMISEIILYESRLLPSGPEYTPIKVFPLFGKRDEGR